MSAISPSSSSTSESLVPFLSTCSTSVLNVTPFRRVSGGGDTRDFASAGLKGEDCRDGGLEWGLASDGGV